MRIRLIKVILLLLVTLVVVGCQEAQSGPKGGSLGANTISIYQLAQTLGLRVSDSTSTHYTLTNPSNTVMIFTCSGGQVYVNTRPVSKTGNVENQSSGVYVSSSLVQVIRSALRNSFTPSPPSNTKPSGCVVVDAGHGGKDPGAPSSLGYSEKAINIQVANKVVSMLRERGIKVIMTRNDDTFIELEDRASVANNNNADLFVSIHADSAGNSSAQGYTLYVARSASWASQNAAKAISRHLSNVASNGRGIQRNDYRVLVKTRCPAVLIEIGYLSNRQEAALLKSGSYQSRLASAITAGITDFLR